MSLTPVSERDLYIDPEDKHADIVSVDKHVDRHEERNLFTYQQGKQLLRRADWHILPILILLYLSKNMDGNLVSVCSASIPSFKNLQASANISWHAVRQNDQHDVRIEHPYSTQYHLQPICLCGNLFLGHFCAL
jgi:hypothetical protein